MKILGIGKIKKDAQGKVTERRYIVEITEVEADMITGIAGKPHIAGRYKPGRQVDIATIYDKVKRINERHAEIIAGATEIKKDATDMIKAMPLVEG